MTSYMLLLFLYTMAKASYNPCCLLAKLAKFVPNIVEAKNILELKPVSGTTDFALISQIKSLGMSETIVTIVALSDNWQLSNKQDKLKMNFHDAHGAVQSFKLGLETVEISPQQVFVRANKNTENMCLV